MSGAVCNQKIMQANESVMRSIFDKEFFLCFYLLKGFIEIISEGTIYWLYPNDLIVFQKENQTEEIAVHAVEYTEMVEVRVSV